MKLVDRIATYDLNQPIAHLLITRRHLGKLLRQGCKDAGVKATFDAVDAAIDATRDPQPPARNLWDLEVFGAMWKADARDIGA